MHVPKSSLRQFLLASLALAPVFLGLPDSGARAQEAQSAIDPSAIADLNRMAHYVNSLESFRLDVTYSFDLISGEEQTVTMDGTAEYLVRRPDRLRARIDNDLFQRDYYYDGAKLTVVTPDRKYYAVADAEPTIREMLASASARLGINLPLAELFDLGTYESPINSITEAFHVGVAVVNGADANHWALRSPERDWEIWIAAGEKPAPVKVTIADTSQPERPRYVAVVTWSEMAAPAGAEFSFAPSPDDKRIEFLAVDSAQGDL